MILLIYLIGFLTGMFFHWCFPSTWPLWAQVVLFPVVLSAGYLIACGMFYKFTK